MLIETIAAMAIAIIANNAVMRMFMSQSVYLKARATAQACISAAHGIAVPINGAEACDCDPDQAPPEVHKKIPNARRYLVRRGIEASPEELAQVVKQSKEGGVTVVIVDGEGTSRSGPKKDLWFEKA